MESGKPFWQECYCFRKLFFRRWKQVLHCCCGCAQLSTNLYNGDFWELQPRFKTSNSRVSFSFSLNPNCSQYTGQARGHQKGKRDLRKREKTSNKWTDICSRIVDSIRKERPVLHLFFLVLNIKTAGIVFPWSAEYHSNKPTNFTFNLMLFLYFSFIPSL